MTMVEQAGASPDYPVVEMPGVLPIFVRSMIIGAMAVRYVRAAALEYAEGLNAAMATWGTEWDADPAPRSFEAAFEAVDSDLEHWDGD